MESFLFYLPGNSWQQLNEIRTTVYRKPTHKIYRQTTWPIILQPYRSHKATTIKTLTRRARLVCDSPHWTKLDNWNASRKTTATTQTLSNSTLTETLNLTRQPTTRLLSQQRLYLTSRYFWDYSTGLTTLRHSCSPQTYHYSTTRTDQRQGQRTTSRQTGSGIPNQVYWLPGYVYCRGKLAETWRQDWLNTNEQPRTVISGITYLNTID